MSLVREADNLPPYSADVKKSRSLNSPRPLWACMACNGCALPFASLKVSLIRRSLHFCAAAYIQFYMLIVLYSPDIFENELGLSSRVYTQILAIFLNTPEIN
jgi:hypothetical protein